MKVTSKDGTAIAFNRAGSGPPLILVDGALCYRAFGPMAAVSALLEPHFTVYTYDRRGRGESGNGKPYAVERKIEDLDALIRDADGSAYVYGASSGGALALEAANRGLAISKLAVYEPPYIVDDGIAPVPEDYVARLNSAVASGRRGDAVKMFMRTVGTPGFFIALMQVMPVWRKLKAVAHTIANDMMIMGEGQRGKPFPPGRFASVKASTLVMDGGKSPPWMRRGIRALADAVPNARYRTLDGQTHMVKAKAQAPVLKDFFTRDVT
jgi:pimeloyl-ACP methyl ester carboxylesterase